LYLHRFSAQQEKPPGVSSQESNSGLPYSTPEHYQLTYAAPLYDVKIETGRKKEKGRMEG
jgi:hypothetical protein